jgi:hypothetical protein
MTKYRSDGLNLHILFCVLVISSCKITYHREEDAVQLAYEFAQTAYSRRDYKAAFKLMIPLASKELSETKLRKIVEAINPLGKPDNIGDFEYEIIPGQAGILVFASAKLRKSMRYYKFAMAGDGNLGYKVAGIWSSATPYVSSGLPRFKVKIKPTGPK